MPRRSRKQGHARLPGGSPDLFLNADRALGHAELRGRLGDRQAFVRLWFACTVLSHMGDILERSIGSGQLGLRNHPRGSRSTFYARSYRRDVLDVNHPDYALLRGALPERAAIVSGHTLGGEVLDASLRVAQNRVQHLETRAKTPCRSGVLSPWLGFRGGYVGFFNRLLPSRH